MIHRVIFSDYWICPEIQGARDVDRSRVLPVRCLGARCCEDRLVQARIDGPVPLQRNRLHALYLGILSAPGDERSLFTDRADPFDGHGRISTPL